MSWFEFGSMPPFLILILGAILAACSHGILQKIIVVAAPIISFANFYLLPENLSITQSLYGLNLELVYSDKLARLFSYLFHLAALIGVIFALQVKDTIQHVVKKTLFFFQNLLIE